jgi:hypothetical protein
MALKIEELQYLVDATDTELSQINGGYAVDIVRTTGDFFLASEASGIVQGQRVNNRSILDRQILLGVPRDVISRGIVAAATIGRGVYTLPVTAGKLEG